MPVSQLTVIGFWKHSFNIPWFAKGSWVTLIKTKKHQSMTNINDETPSTITITISTIVTPGKKAATPHILGGNRGPSLVTLVAPCMGKVNMVIIIIITIIKVTTVIHIIIILYSMIMIVILITVILPPLSPSPYSNHGHGPTDQAGHKEEDGSRPSEFPAGDDQHSSANDQDHLQYEHHQLKP